ncbi:MAG: hypothetical protein E6J12_13600 [Chloroflexi bacterium]|nr:MAG: hypothetical protein E6J12_13600 [Chloroflexota bacterium]
MSILIARIGSQLSSDHRLKLYRVAGLFAGRLTASTWMPALATPSTAFPPASDGVPAPPSSAMTTPGVAGTVCTVMMRGAITNVERADIVTA